MQGVLLALGASLAWGTGDFVAGLTARRLSVLTVIVVSGAIGLLLTAPYAVLGGDPFLGAPQALAAAGAGCAGLVGLASLYRGFAVGAMGIVAPISAAAPLVPLAVDVARGETPGPLQSAGIVLVLGGIALASREPSHEGARLAAGAGLAVVAALGFGLFFVGIDVAADESAGWAATVSRATSVVLAAGACLALRAPLRPPAALVPALVATGLADASANVLFAVSSTEGSVGIVSVIASLYPLVVIGLARVVLRERPSRTQQAGGLIALAGVALVAGG